MSRTARLVFMGSPEFALPSLDALAKAHSVCAVFTQPPRRKNRGMKLVPTPVGAYAEQLGIACFSPEKLTYADHAELLAGYDADMFIVVAYGQILSRQILDIPALGCVNAHASLLPRWRGAAPIQRAIQAGDKMTGITAMMMAQGLDTGPMLNRTEIQITADMTASDLHDRLAEMAATTLLDAVDSLMAGTARPETQDDAQACYAAKISSEEAALSLAGDAEQLGCHIRAFSPFPGAYIQTISGRLKLLHADIAENAGSADEGRFLGCDHQGRMLIGCGSGVLAISHVQLAGKNRMRATEFLNGQNWQAGQQITLPPAQ
jgi:methionyl-tRNA formyltransferase